MVNDDSPAEPERAADAERRLALAYAPARARGALAALFALDRELGDLVRTTREPMVGQMRLAWWRDALTGLGAGPAPAQPVLRALAGHLPAGVGSAMIARIVEGWEVLLVTEVLDDTARDRFAHLRGGMLFELAGQSLCGGAAPERVRAAGEGWALADLANNLSDPAAAAAAMAAARPRLDAALRSRWPRALRPLGALAHFARIDGRRHPAPPGGREMGGKALRGLWHWVSGY